jgi:RNA-directed DNA polymerase
MTKPRYVRSSCAAGSQVHGQASSPAAWSPASYAWIVNFNNGNANNNHHDNKCFVRPVRSLAAPGECQGATVSFQALFDAWREARRQKVPSENQLAFETRWIDGLLELEGQIAAGTWSPRRATCFIAQRPKARQIHAPDFADRVVHHWLVPQLEAIYEPTFIHDSYANRKGKGTHAAVRRLSAFVREVASGQGGGWYLQLDVRNFFNSIHRPTLWAMLKRRMARAHVPGDVQRTVHALLRHPVQRQGVVHRSTARERARVPAHKRLENAPPGCGIPIGNLSSQFFANVYLDRLDQFVKHELKAQRYLRYVDDFVLVHRDRAQLEAWTVAIAAFLRAELRLELKADVRLRPLSAGVDFLGYVVYPTHVRVRRRVVRHAFSAIAASLIAPPGRLRAVLASYLGHFAHANAERLRARLTQASTQ